VADAETDEPTGRIRAFAWSRIHVLVETVAGASSTELVRGFLALVLVVVLLLLVITPPGGKDDVVASSKTLAIAVIAFYFGLHRGTPRHGKQTPT